MMKKAISLLFFLALTALLYSDENAVIERSSFNLKLSIDENNYWEWTVPQSQYILDGKYIQFYTGETLFIEADIINDKIIKLTVVKEIINENKTIIINVSQITKEENERIHNFMMLTIKNPFDNDIDYKADVYLLQYNRWINTSTIPVRAGLLSYEMWSDIISTIVLYDFVLK
jgi:hypothetical protein